MNTSLAFSKPDADPEAASVQVPAGGVWITDDGDTFAPDHTSTVRVWCYCTDRTHQTYGPGPRHQVEVTTYVVTTAVRS